MLDSLGKPRSLVLSWQPNPSLKSDPLLMHKSRLFNTFLLTMAVGCGGLLIISQISAWPDFNMEILVPEVAALVLIAFCYGLNRSGHIQTAAVIFFVSTVILMAFYLSGRSDHTVGVHLRSVSTLLAVPVLASGIIMTPLFSFFMAGAGVITILGVALLRVKPGVAWLDTPAEAISNMAVPISLLLVMAGLAWLIDNNLKSLLGQLTARNQTLDAANLTLEQKYRAEQQFGQRVNSISGQVAAAFERQSLHGRQQSAAVGQVSQLIEQLDTLSTIITSTATEVDNVTLRAYQVASEGTSSVQNGLAKLETVQEQAQNTALAIQNLAQQAQQITQIIALISSLAEETSLLALNARIEAAGAGVYGRRFACVANEVEQLAARSRQASQQVRLIVEQVGAAIARSAMLTDKGLRDTQTVLQETRSMEQTLDGIVASSGQAADLTRQICQFIQEQHGITLEVVSTVQEISALSGRVGQESRLLLGSITTLSQTVARSAEI